MLKFYAFFNLIIVSKLKKSTCILSSTNEKVDTTPYGKMTKPRYFLFVHAIVMSEIINSIQ